MTEEQRDSLLIEMSENIKTINRQNERPPTRSKRSLLFRVNSTS